METASLRLVGDFGFLLLRGSLEKPSQLGFCAELTSVRIEYGEEQQVSVYGERKCGDYRPGSMRWLSMNTCAQLTQLTVECSNTQIQLDTLSFEPEALLTVLGEQNFLAFTNCAIEQLELHSERPNNLDFREQGALRELNATLHGSHMQARLCGFNWSSVCGYDGSNIFLYIEQQFHSRTFDFTKDTKSQILIETQDEPQRVVTAQHEQWDVGDKLHRISLVQETPAAYAVDQMPESEQPSGTPQCVVCRSALPTYMVEPCTHICICSACAPSYREHNLTACPLCRTQIEQLKHVFLACS